jgi:hypothetical protein
MIQGLVEDWEIGGGAPRRWPLSQAAQARMVQTRREHIQQMFTRMQGYVERNGAALLHRDYGYYLRSIQEERKNVGGYCIVSTSGELAYPHYLTSGEHGVFSGVVDRGTCVEAKALRAAAATRSIAQILIYTRRYPCVSCRQKITAARGTGAFLVTVKYEDGRDYP